MSVWMEIFDGAPEQVWSERSALFRREDTVRSMHLVRSGTIALERSSENGVPLTLHVATAGKTVAEASLFAEAYHCDAVVRDEARVAVLPRGTVLAAIRARPDAGLGLIEAYAKEVQAQRWRIEILRLRRVSERLDAWLDLNGPPASGQWVRVAEEIGVSPPALYRELARRRG